MVQRETTPGDSIVHNFDKTFAGYFKSVTNCKNVTFLCRDGNKITAHSYSLDNWKLINTQTLDTDCLYSSSMKHYFIRDGAIYSFDSVTVRKEIDLPNKNISYKIKLVSGGQFYLYYQTSNSKYITVINPTNNNRQTINVEALPVDLSSDETGLVIHKNHLLATNFSNDRFVIWDVLSVNFMTIPLSENISREIKSEYNILHTQVDNSALRVVAISNGNIHVFHFEGPAEELISRIGTEPITIDTIGIQVFYASTKLDMTENVEVLYSDKGRGVVVISSEVEIDGEVKHKLRVVKGL